MAKKKKYSSAGKRFVGPTEGGKMVWEGKGRKGKRGKFYSKGATGKVRGVSGKDAASAAKRGVPVRTGRLQTIRSLAIPKNANLSPIIRTRTSLPGGRTIKIVGSGRGTTTSRLKIPSPRTTAGGSSITKSILGKLTKGVPVVGTAMALLTPNKTATASQERQHMKGAGWEKAYKPTKTVPKKAATGTVKSKPPPKTMPQASSVTKKVVNQPKSSQTKAINQPKVKALSPFGQAFKAARYGKSGYEGKTFDFKGKKYLAVSKDDLKKFKVKTLGQYKVKKLAMKIARREIAKHKPKKSSVY